MTPRKLIKKKRETKRTHKKICIRHNKHCYANNCEILGEMEKQNLSTLKQEEMEILHIQITIIEI